MYLADASNIFAFFTLKGMDWSGLSMDTDGLLSSAGPLTRARRKEIEQAGLMPQGAATS